MSDTEKSSSGVSSSESDSSKSGSSSSAGRGCTNPHSPNYDETATDDDGSCLTCANQGLCVFGDTCKGPDCNEVGNGCCDSGCLPCLDEDDVMTPDDCSPTFSNAFTATNGTFYASCYG